MEMRDDELRSSNEQAIYRVGKGQPLESRTFRTSGDDDNFW
jgi:hypothetical protein